MLRSINVGGRNRVAMAELRGLVSSLGFTDVATYVQSGNVVFSGAGTPAATARAIEGRIVSELGLTVPVVVRSKPQWRRALDDNPFSDLDVDAKTIHITFLADRPRAGGVSELAEMSGSFGADRFEVIGQQVHLHCPGGYGETKLNNSFLERRLGVTATTRNWRTITALAEMAVSGSR